ncbi:Uncharacterised protein [Serratia plymuthica]|nr:Uncharacterised protein [Serratia plymuthica]
MPKLYPINSIFYQPIASHYNVPNPSIIWNIIVLIDKNTEYNKQNIQQYTFKF